MVHTSLDELFHKNLYCYSKLMEMNNNENVYDLFQPHVSQVVSMVDGHPRRTRVPDKPNYPLSLWSIMKNCIGQYSESQQKL